jgi:hypothetical protein
MESPQFGLVDDQTGAKTLPYWVQKTLNDAFPAGSTMLSSSSTNAGVQTLAAKRADGKISVLVVNRQLNSTTTKGGAGLPAVISVNVPGVSASGATLQQIDRNTSVASGPSTTNLAATGPYQVSLPGFGFGVLTLNGSGGGTPGPTASPTASVPPDGLSLTVSTPDIQPTQSAVLSSSGRPGSTQELLCYSRPSTSYSLARTVTTSSGSASFALRPGTNTRCFVRYVDDPASASPSVVVNVHTTLSLSAVRNAGVPRGFVFQGRNLPRLSGQLITLYRLDGEGREIRTATTKTDSSGTWRIPRTFTGSGTFAFVVHTTQTLTNAPGRSAPYRLAIS